MNSSGFLDQMASDDAEKIFHKLIDLCCSDSWTAAATKIDGVPVHQCRLMFNLIRRLAAESPETWEQSLQDEDDVNIPETLVPVLLDCLRLRRLELFKEAIVRQAIKNGAAHLVNYDWSVVYVVCNDQASDLCTKLFQLTLVLATDQGHPSHQMVRFEFTRDELMSFIDFLQNAHRDLTDRLLLKPSDEATEI